MLESAHNVFIVGIKGVAMANLAIILQQMGKNVSGCDVAEEFITDESLKQHSITFIHSFDPNDFPAATDFVVYSGGHQGAHNPMIQEAQKRNIPVKTQIEVLSEIMDGYTHRISVCGSHGKTTTTGFLATMLKELGKDPGYMVGTSTFNGKVGGAKGNGEYFIMESDEYGVSPPDNKTPKFYLLNPNYILATTIDFDHPDVYKDIEETKIAFSTFFQKVKSEPHHLFVCADDKNLMDVVASYPRSSYTTYGYHEEADIHIQDVEVGERTSFDLYTKEAKIDTFTISLFGEKNVSNATGAIALLFALGFRSDEIKRVTSTFIGSKRRFEQVAYENGIYIFDDYAHHPNEIRATINAARSRFPESKIFVVFQPHTYSRTQALKGDFVTALSHADTSFIAPIFASAREKTGGDNISNRDLESFARESGIDNVQSFSLFDSLAHELRTKIRYGDVVFTMGAGDIYKLKNDIIKLIKSI